MTGQSNPEQLSAPLDGVFVERAPTTCACLPDCEFPCWQRLGIANACEECGCSEAVDLEAAA